MIETIKSFEMEQIDLSSYFYLASIIVLNWTYYNKII